MGVRASKLKERRRMQIGFGETPPPPLPPPPPPLPPKGYVPISVGFDNNTRRYIVHTKALADADFLELLRKSAEEYGFCNQGVLKIPYEAKDFEEWILGRNYKKIIKEGVSNEVHDGVWADVNLNSSKILWGNRTYKCGLLSRLLLLLPQLPVKNMKNF